MIWSNVGVVKGSFNNAKYNVEYSGFGLGADWWSSDGCFEVCLPILFGGTPRPKKLAFLLIRLKAAIKLGYLTKKASELLYPFSRYFEFNFCMEWY